MATPLFSVVVPAHNEEAFLPGCLDAIARASDPYPGAVQVIVVLNRCTDGTAWIAAARGALTVASEARNLAAIRNAGAARATGEILITIDADSRMSANMLAEAEHALRSGRFIGGGVPIQPDRISPAIFLTGIAIMAICLSLGVQSAGLFWCYRRDFEAVGGFDERKHSAEDVDFARRLRAYGAAQGKRYGTLWKTRLITSSRKFDRFGDWFFLGLLLRHPLRTWRALRGRDQALANRFWYDIEW